MKITVTIFVLALMAISCGGNTQTNEAVQQGVMEHLAGRSGLDVNSMDVEVTDVTFRENEADAVVSFKPKGSTDPDVGMQMKYTLERKGGRWVVKGKAGASDTPHGGGMANPHGGAMESPHGATPPEGGMPSGHPPIGEADSPGTTE